jgi:hypothetical protein
VLTDDCREEDFRAGPTAHQPGSRHRFLIALKQVEQGGNEPASIARLTSPLEQFVAKNENFQKICPNLLRSHALPDYSPLDRRVLNENAPEDIHISNAQNEGYNPSRKSSVVR